jgi:hypothetical protein
MSKTIDVSDLLDEDVKFVKELVIQLKQRAIKKKKKVKEEDIDFASTHLGVKGKVTRKEIYDYL